VYLCTNVGTITLLEPRLRRYGGALACRRNSPHWDKDFGSFKLCGKGSLPKTFLLSGQAAQRVAI
jgi:hypothetical protein